MPEKRINNEKFYDLNRFIWRFLPYLKIPILNKFVKYSNMNTVATDKTVSPTNSNFRFKNENRIKKSSDKEKNYEKIFSINDIWVILKGGRCIFEYHKNGEDELQLNSILFGGFIYAIHSFAYQLIDQGIDKIRIHETEFKFIDFGDIILLSMVEEGLNELVVKNFLYKIGERFIKLYFNKINRLSDNWPEIKDEFTQEIDAILSDSQIRYLIVLSTIKELIIKVYSSKDDLMFFYWHAIKLLRPLKPQDLLLLYDDIRRFIDDLVKIDAIDTLQTLKNGFSHIVFHFVNSYGSNVALNDINYFELNDKYEIEVISSLLNYDS